MTFHPPGENEDAPDDVNPVELPPEPPAEVVEQQRRHLRRIMFGFVAVVLLLPIAGLGGALSWLLLPVVAIAAFALREAIRLRRSVTRHGAARVR